MTNGFMIDKDGKKIPVTILTYPVEFKPDLKEKERIKQNEDNRT